MQPHPTLLRNLRALAKHSADLAERLTWSAASEHVRIPQDGPALYRTHRDWAPFEAGAEDLQATLAAAPDDGTVLLFGVGLGEQLVHLLRERPRVSIIGWERDPWLLRSMLTRHDVSRALLGGRLRLALGVDLLTLPPVAACMEHPFLGVAYGLERQLLDDGAAEPAPEHTACLAVGGLFVDDLAHALREEGYRVVPVDADRWSAEELGLAIERAQPDLFARVNYRAGLAEFCAARDLPLCVWEIDPATDRPPACKTPVPRAHIHTYRAANVAHYRAAGFEHVFHTPLAANPAKRQPLAYTTAQREHYQAPVSFVGSSLIASAQQLAAEIGQRFLAWHPDGADAAPLWKTGLRAVLDGQRADARYNIGAHLDERFPGFLEHLRHAAPNTEWDVYVGELAAAEHRLNLVGALAPLGVHVWGDPGWRALVPHGANYRGVAGHTRDVSRVYGASQVNIDIGRLYQRDIVTMRVFDVLACGGFLLCEDTPALAELFEVGHELDTFGSREELVAKTGYYLEYPDRARAIAERGRARVLADHTFGRRVAGMLAELGCPSGRRLPH